MQKQKYHDLRKYYSQARKNTIQKPASLYTDYVYFSYVFQIDQICVFGFLLNFSLYSSIYRHFEVAWIYKIAISKWDVGKEVEMGVKWPNCPWPI